MTITADIRNAASECPPKGITPGVGVSSTPAPKIEKGDAVTSTLTPAKTRCCKTCNARLEYREFPRDKYGRIDARMCLPCVDENTPSLMTEGELSRWLAIPITAVRGLPVDGTYNPPKGAPVALYSRPAVSTEFLPTGWRTAL